MDCKKGIVFPILKELNLRPAAASGNIGYDPFSPASI
jgi:hypothetical protein